MLIKELRPDLVKKLRRYSLQKKYKKAAELFESNPRHPSLNTELMEPKVLGIWSFRIDRKFRAQLIIVNGEAEITDVTVHYQ